MVHSGGEPVTVGLNAKPFAKFAWCWTQPRVARMSIVLLITGESSYSEFRDGTVKCACLGIQHRSGQEYVVPLDSVIPLREQG